MTTLYIGSFTLVFLGVIFALWPYISYRLFGRLDDSVEVIEREAVNVSLYRDHLNDLEKSLQSGLIDQEQYEQLKQELERNLIEDSHTSRINSVNTTEDAKKSGSKLSGLLTRSHAPVFLMSALVVPIACFALYQYLGNFEGVRLESKLAKQNELQQQLATAKTSDVEQLRTSLAILGQEIVDGLIKHSAKDETNLDTRVLLARNAVNIGDYDTAIKHFRLVLEAQPQAAQIMVEMAQAIFVQANNNVVPVVSILVERALALQPDNVMGLSLQGIAHFQTGAYQKSIAVWERAIGLYPPGSANGAALQNGIVQARARLADNVVANERSSIESEQGSADKNTSVTVNVSLASNVSYKPDAMVFVYARAWAGGKLPLAITRVSASDLPISIKLDNTMAMSPEFNLSSAKTIQLVARVSETGNAIAAEGDWEAISGPIDMTSSNSSEHVLEISQPFSASSGG